MARLPGPLLTRESAAALHAARRRGETGWQGSLDLGRSEETVVLRPEGFLWRGEPRPWPEGPLKERTLYHFDGVGWAPVQRFSGSLIKLVPSEWGPPTFEIDGIKMLPTARVSPWDDAAAKVALVEPRGRRLLDCCGGLGYYAAHALAAGAAEVRSFEKNPDVLWLRCLNPWSPDPDEPTAAGRLVLTQGDIASAISSLPDGHFDAALHDPPRFGIAGELYSLAFYRELARVLKPGAPLFHYTGSPNAKTSGRDVPGEVLRRLEQAGFRAERRLDGVLARRLGPHRR
ncbi:SAM-dependent methyltransferase [Silanimonas lenta]|uniref:class I SAM-dependent methyltransferase n=1 Tax=Silanimonas lenta TaxID=265429 RepID=UPI002FE3258C